MNKNSNCEKKIKQKLKPHYKKYVITAFLLLLVFLTFISSIFIIVASSSIYHNIDIELCSTAEMAMRTVRVTETTNTDGTKEYTVSRFDMSPGRQIYLIYYIDGNIYTTNDDIYMYLIPGYAEFQIKKIDGSASVYDTLEFDEQKDAANQLLVLQAQTNKIGKTLTEAVKNGNNTYYFRTQTYVNSDDTSPIDYYKVLIYCNDVVRTHRTIITVYIWCLVFDLLLILVISLYIAKVVMKPLEESLDKQMKFVGDASHELRTPLAIVHSNLENILTNSDHTVEEESENIVSSLQEIQRLSKMTNELLELASSDNNTMKFNYSLFNVGTIVSKTGCDFQELAQLQNKTLTYSSEDCDIMGDCDRIKQVILILLDNALKYSEEGDSINISLTSNNSEAILEVSDTGKGISDEAMSHVFERFYREDKAHSRSIQGNGLGLSIALAIVNEHHGTISVHHNQPKGSIFTVTLPKKQK